MPRRGSLIGLLVLVAALLFPSSSLVSEDEQSPSLFRVAAVADLVHYPQEAPPSDEALEPPSYAVVLPGTELAVVLRPITQGEYGSFQVRAIGYEIIEREMLAAAFVLPHVTAGEIAGFPPDLLRFFREGVNALSGFEVFTVGPVPSSP